MKECSKQLIKQDKESILTVTEAMMFQEGWRQALKWALNHPDLIDHYQLDYVKEELQNE